MRKLRDVITLLSSMFLPVLLPLYAYRSGPVGTRPQGGVGGGGEQVISGVTSLLWQCCWHRHVFCSLKETLTEAMHSCIGKCPSQLSHECHEPPCLLTTSRIAKRAPGGPPLSTAPECAPLRPALCPSLCWLQG
jgi:hypothetical protein